MNEETPTCFFVVEIHFHSENKFQLLWKTRRNLFLIKFGIKMIHKFLEFNRVIEYFIHEFHQLSIFKFQNRKVKYTILD